METTPDKLAAIHLKITEARSKLKQQFDEDDAKLKAQLDIVNEQISAVLNELGMDGAKTHEGTITRTKSQLYWPSDWDAMYQFVLDRGLVNLLERRIHQTNMKEYLENHSEVPQGLNVTTKFKITVRKPKRGE